MSDVPMPALEDSSSRAPSSRIAEQLRGFGPVGLLALAVILAGNLLIVPLSAVFAIGIPFGVALKLAMKAIVMPLFGAPAVNAPYHYLAGNTAALPWMFYAVIVGAGFGEETVFRGFFFERLGKLLGAGRAAL